MTLETPAPTRPRIQIKGIKDGLLVTLGDGAWDDMRQALLEHIDQQAEFLRGARLALDVGNHILKAVELSQFRKEIADRELTLWAVMSESPATIQTARNLGLEVSLAKLKPERALPAIETTLRDGENATLVRRTLRSGFILKTPGHVVVIGDVNPGAEIVAGGDVVVWGRLRGTVHAGAGGNEQCVVCALDLSPTQLRIAGKIALSPKRKGKPQPEMARLENGQFVAEPWDPKRERV